VSPSGASPHSDLPPEDRSVGEMVLDVSERLSILIREEVELAKTEVTEKVTKLLRGSGVGIAAGIFALLGLAMMMHSIAWLLDDLFFSDNIWIGFAIEAVAWFGIAAAAGLFAYRALKAGAPPVPEMAIEEARLTREALSGDSTEATP
jgi:uncharacterized membrane protein YqjE